VHVLFGGYTVSFTIRDINRALQLMAEAGDSTYGTTSGLDTTKQYTVELYPGYRTEYRTTIQPMLQLGVGAFLLRKGKAVVQNPKHKKLKMITIDVTPVVDGENLTDIKFYDPANNNLVFNGQMIADMYNMDLGIDNY
jgi:hypothetical protein